VPADNFHREKKRNNVRSASLIF